MTLSVDKYERLKRRDRQPLAVEELSDAEIEAISRVEPPAVAAQYNHELTEGQSTAGRRVALIQKTPPLPVPLPPWKGGEGT